MTQLSGFSLGLTIDVHPHSQCQRHTLSALRVVLLTQQIHAGHPTYDETLQTLAAPDPVILPTPVPLLLVAEREPMIAIVFENCTKTFFVFYSLFYPPRPPAHAYCTGTIPVHRTGRGTTHIEELK